MYIDWGSAAPAVDFIDAEMPTLRHLSVQWVEFLSGSDYDRIVDIAISEDDGSVLASGLTNSKDFDGHKVQVYSGNPRSFASKFSVAGNKMWSLIHEEHEIATVSSLDIGGDGSFYVAFYNTGSASLSKYSANGLREWTTQVGGSSSGRGVSFLAGEENSIFFAGEGWSPIEDGIGNYMGGYDAFLSNLSTDGRRKWIKTIEGWSFRGHEDDLMPGTKMGYSGEFAQGVVAGEDGFVYIYGHTWADADGYYGSIEQYTGFIAKFSADGSHQWTELLGIGNDETIEDVAIDSVGNVYLAGRVTHPQKIISDGYIMKISDQGEQVWSKIIGGGGMQESIAVSIDNQDSVYILGETYGSLDVSGAQETPGAIDIFLNKYDEDGGLLWTQLIGGEHFDDPGDMEVADDGSIYIAGSTYGKSDSSRDTFLMKIKQVDQLPERASIVESIDQITEQKQVSVLSLNEAILMRGQYVETLIAGTGKKDKITGSSEREVLAGGLGKDILEGGGGADGFLFNQSGEYGKRKADKIKDFDSNDGDSILVDKGVMGLGKKIKLKVVGGKKLSKRAARSKKDFVYDEWKGLLYFNENGKQKGWGDGGLFAKLQGAPELGVDDFTIV